MINKALHDQLYPTLQPYLLLIIPLLILAVPQVHYVLQISVPLHTLFPLPGMTPGLACEFLSLL